MAERSISGVWGVSVSYTHLDVYKRQCLDRLTVVFTSTLDLKSGLPPQKPTLLSTLPW